GEWVGWGGKGEGGGREKVRGATGWHVPAAGGWSNGNLSGAAGSEETVGGRESFMSTRCESTRCPATRCGLAQRTVILNDSAALRRLPGAAHATANAVVEPRAPYPSNACRLESRSQRRYRG